MELNEYANDGLDDLLRFAHALIPDRGTAEDVVQEVLIKLFLASDRTDDIHHVVAYARRMVVNQYLSWGRRWFRVHPVRDLGDQPDPHDAVGVVGDRDELCRELAALPPRQRAVLVLRFYCGMGDLQIAAELGCSVWTVRSHASRGLAALRIQLTTSVEQEQDSNYEQ